VIRRERKYDDCASEAAIVVRARQSEFAKCFIYIRFNLIKVFPTRKPELNIISSLLRSYLLYRNSAQTNIPTANEVHLN